MTIIENAGDNDTIYLSEGTHSILSLLFINVYTLVYKLSKFACIDFLTNENIFYITSIFPSQSLFLQTTASSIALDNRRI